jgi:hypothetical protein
VNNRQEGETTMNVADRSAWVAKIIHGFWASEITNTLGNGTGEKAWDEPLVAFARGDDPLFEKIKKDIGPFYWTPAEVFDLAFPGAPRTVEDLSVVSWVLPQTEATKADQRREMVVPSERWARSRYYGEEFNCRLRLHLVATLTAAGFPAVAPERLPEYAPHCRSERFGLSANWSERHAAWIAGHGTFGLSDGLITVRGKAVRFGSVIVACPLVPTKRPYSGHQDWCLWYSRGTCGACIRRCPGNAISEAGHNKDKCFHYSRTVTTPYATAHYGTGSTPCGLCQVKIPCESRNPTEVIPDRQV